MTVGSEIHQGAKDGAAVVPPTSIPLESWRNTPRITDIVNSSYSTAPVGREPRDTTFQTL